MSIRVDGKDSIAPATPVADKGDPIMKRGRPSQNDRRSIDTALIDATFAALNHKSHTDLTISEVARMAGTQPSMVRYYFDDKYGLLSAVSKILARHTESRMADVERNFDPGLGVAEPILRALTEIYYNPYYSGAANIMLIESLRPDSTLIEAYRSHVAKRSIVRMMRMIRACIQEGHYRNDLDIPSAILSIMSLVAGPITCAPMLVGRGHGKAEDHEPWIRLSTSMLEHMFVGEAR